MDGTTVGKIQLGVELPGLDEQISHALKGVEGKLNQALGKSAGTDEVGQKLSESLDRGVQSADAAAKRIGETFDGLANQIGEKFEALFKRLENLKLTQPTGALNPNETKIPGSMAMPKMAMPRAPPLRVELDRATQYTHLEQQLSVLDQRWEALDGIARRHSDTVERLQAEYRKLVDDAVVVDGKKFMNTKGLEKAKGDISAAQLRAAKAVEAVVSVEQSADRVRAKMSQLTAAAEQPAAAVQSRLGGAFDAVRARASGALAQIRQGIGGLGNRFSQMGGSLGGLIGRFNQVGNSAQSAGRRGAFSFQGLANSIMMVARRVLFLNVAYKAIRGFISYVGQAAQTTDGWAASLATIRLNLAAAFQPILNVILPILNTLAAALAKVTGHIAAFMAALFGTTYKASVQGAREMKTAIDGIGEGAGGVGDVGKKAGGAGKGLKGAGAEAKKLQGILAGFDELNILTFPDDKDSGSGGGGGSPSGGGGGGGGGLGGWETAAATELGDTSMWDKLADRLKNLFEPFKRAWENEGANTIAAMKFMLQEIGLLLAAIGRSFEVVWTNGTGQLMLERILRILQNVFYLIGEIAQAFRIAWEDDGRGTQIIQNIFDGINNLLYVTEGVTQALRNVWRLGGQDFANNFMLAVLASTALWSHFTGKIRELWDSNGRPVFEKIATLVLEIGTTLLFMYHAFAAPALEALITMFAWAFDGILWAAQPVLDILIGFFKWLRGDGIVVLAAFTAVLAGWALAWLATTAPIMLVVLAVGAVIQGIRALVANWDAAKAWLIDSFGVFGELIAGALEAVGGAFGRLGDKIAGLFPAKVEEGTTKSQSAFDRLNTGTSTTLSGLEKSVAGSASGMADALGMNINAGARNWEKGVGDIDITTEKAMRKASGSVDSNMTEMLKSVGYNSAEIDSVLSSMTKDIGTFVPLEFSGMNLASSREIGDMADTVIDRSEGMQRDTTAEMEMLGMKTQYTMKAIKDNTTREFEELHDAVKKSLTDVVRLSSTSATAIRDAFRSISLYTIGQDIVNGLMRGMTSRSSALYSNLSSMVSNTIRSVKRGYGIASPSKVFDREIGQQLPLGAARGVDRMAPVFADALNDMMHIPELEQPLLANVGRSGGSSAQAQASTQASTLQEIAELLRELLDKPDDDSSLALTVNVGGERLVDQMIDGVRERQRRLGGAVFEV